MSLGTLPWGQIGPLGGLVGLTVLLVWLLATGRLQTRPQIEAQDRAHEREVGQLQKANDILQDALAQSQAQMSEVLVGQRTILGFITTLQARVDGRADT